MDPLLKVSLFLVFRFIIWGCFSAWLFSMVEYTEKDNKEEKYQLLLSLYDSMASKYNMTIEEFNNFSNVAHEALSDPKPQWTYSASLNFVFQAVTTIGYGFITPQTPAGQILCIFVSLLGIPITMLALKSVGEVIAKLVNRIVTKFEKKILKRAEPKQVQIKSAVILFLLMMLQIIVNSLVVIQWEDWTLIQGVYFWFVTMTTIGFGDYVLANSNKLSVISKHHKSGAPENGSKAFVGVLFTFYTLLGLCIVSSVLNSIMAAIEELKCRPRCPGCVPRKTQDHVDTPKQRDDINMISLNSENVGFQNKNMDSN